MMRQTTKTAAACLFACLCLSSAAPLSEGSGAAAAGNGSGQSRSANGQGGASSPPSGRGAGADELHRQDGQSRGRKRGHNRGNGSEATEGTRLREEIEIFDVQSFGMSVPIPLTVRLAGQKVFGPKDEDPEYLVDNRVVVPPGGGTLRGSIDGHIEVIEGPTATACPGGRPGQRFSLVAHGASVAFELEFVGTGPAAPLSRSLSEPIPLRDDGTTVELAVCRN